MYVIANGINNKKNERETIATYFNAIMIMCCSRAMKEFIFHCGGIVEKLN